MVEARTASVDSLPGSEPRISPSSDCIAVSAATSRALPDSSATARWKPLSARRYSAKSPNADTSTRAAASALRSHDVIDDERARSAPTTRLDVTGITKDGECLTQGHRGDVKSFGELNFGWQPLSRLQHTRANGFAKAPDDPFNRSLDAQGGEDGVACGRCRAHRTPLGRVLESTGRGGLGAC